MKRKKQNLDSIILKKDPEVGRLHASFDCIHHTEDDFFYYYRPHKHIYLTIAR